MVERADAVMLGDLEAMVAFVRVVDTGSFTAAARLLGTTTPTVSKRISRFEQSLGVRLLERTTRRVAATEAGRGLYEVCTRTLRDLDAAKRSVALLATAPRGLLRVVADDAVAERALAPLLPAFLRQYPDLRLELVSAVVDDVDLVEQGFEVAVRVGAGLESSSMLVRRVGAVDTVVCAAPGYLAAWGTPATLDALAGHAILHLGGPALEREWTLREGSRPVVVPVSARAQLSSVAALRAAAVAGLGLVHLPRIAVAEELRDGRLRPVLQNATWHDLPVQTLQPAGRQRALRASAFVEFLARELPDKLHAPAAHPVANSNTSPASPQPR